MVLALLTDILLSHVVHIGHFTLFTSALFTSALFTLALFTLALFMLALFTLALFTLALFTLFTSALIPLFMAALFALVAVLATSSNRSAVSSCKNRNFFRNFWINGHAASTDDEVEYVFPASATKITQPRLYKTRAFGLESAITLMLQQLPMAVLALATSSADFQ